MQTLTMDDDGLAPPKVWSALARDIGVLLFLLIVAFTLFGQADRHQPRFTAEDIHVVEAPISGFTTVQVPETAAAPQINSSTPRSRPAFQLSDRPANILSYIPGSPWRLEGDYPVGTLVRLEVIDDPRELLERARANPESQVLQEIAGLQIGDRVYFRGSDSIARAGAASRCSSVYGSSSYSAAASTARKGSAGVFANSGLILVNQSRYASLR